MSDPNEWIAAHEADLIADLQSCIAIPSVFAADDSGFPYGAETARCLAWMLDRAQAFGFETRNLDNHLGWCEYGQGEEMVAALCHLDVVPEGEGWTVPPYGGLVRDGRIYGRGAMDDKGPAVAALYALAALKAAGTPLRRRVRLLFGLNEESGSADMKYYLSQGGEIPVMGITPDGEYPVINGEKGLVTETWERTLRQSGALRLLELRGGEAPNIVPAHAWARFRCLPELAEQLCARSGEKIACMRTEDGLLVRAEGIGAHGGSPWTGENAIGRLMLFLDGFPLEGELKSVVNLLATRFGLEWDGTSLGIALEDSVSGKLTMNLGVVTGDATRLALRLNYRYPVTCSYDQCAPQVERILEEAGFRRTAQTHKKQIYMPPDSPLVARLMKVYRACTGDLTSQPLSIGGGTYAKMIPNTLAFGPVFPGDEVREHKPDEYMELSRLMDNARMLATAMKELAG